MKFSRVLAAMTAIVCFAFCATADEYDDQHQKWAESRKSRVDPTTVWVGNEIVYLDEVTLPYAYACGAVLHKTKGGYRLDLPGIRISDLCIQANGDLAILVTGDNYIDVNAKRGGFTAFRGPMVYAGILAEDVLIFGRGNLTITSSLDTRNYSTKGISAGEFGVSGKVNVAMGTTLSIGGVKTGVDCASFEMNLAKLRLSGIGNCGIDAYGHVLLDCACVAGTSSGTGIYAADDVDIIASLVDVHAAKDVIECSGSVMLFQSYLTMLSWGGSCVDSYKEFLMHQCAVSGYSGGGYAALDTPNTLSVGEGRYTLVAADGGAGLRGGYVVLEGGDVEVCAPKGTGCYLYEGPYAAASNTVESGSFKVSEKIDIKKLLTADLESAALYGVSSALLSSSLDGFLADVGGVLLMDGVNTLASSFQHGKANCGILYPPTGAGTVYHEITSWIGATEKSSYVWLDGGTVLLDGAETGVKVPNLVIEGGSFHGTYALADNAAPMSVYFLNDGSLQISPLKCVEEQFAGSPGDKIASGWKTSLPGYYGTGSLYLDDNRKLYFWLPQDWDPAVTPSSEPTPVNPEPEQGPVNPTPLPTNEPMDASAAQTYDCMLTDGSGGLAGVVTVKSAKANGKTGLVKLTVSVQFANGGKTSLKGDYNPTATDAQSFVAKDGSTLSLALGADSAAGAFVGCSLEGVRNVFVAKDAASKAAASAAEAKYVGTYNLISDEGQFSVTVAKKGKVKVTGTAANGVKVSVSAQLLVGNGTACVPVIAPKAGLAFVMRFGESSSVSGLSDAVIGRPGALASGSVFGLDAAALAKLLGDGSYAAYCPNGLSVEQSGGKWVVAGGAKTGKVALKNGVIDVAKLGANPSALKLTYTAKSGTFKGSFKAYVNGNGKPKAVAFSVSGVVVGGKGYGIATAKKYGSVAITIGEPSSNGVSEESSGESKQEDPSPNPNPTPSPSPNPKQEDPGDNNGGTVTPESGTVLYTGFVRDSSPATGSKSWPITRGTIEVKIAADGSLAATIDSFFGKVDFSKPDLNATDLANEDVDVTLTGPNGEKLDLEMSERYAWYDTNMHGSVTGGIFGTATYDIIGSRDQFTSTMSAAEAAGVKAFAAVAKGTYRIGVVHTRTEAEKQTSSGVYPYDWFLGTAESGTMSLTVGDEGVATLEGTLEGRQVTASTKLLFWTGDTYAVANFYMKDGACETFVGLSIHTDSGKASITGDGWRKER